MLFHDAFGVVSALTFTGQNLIMNIDCNLISSLSVNKTGYEPLLIAI